MPAKATNRALRWRAIRQRRASIAWTRETLAAYLAPILTSTFLAFLLARLAQRHARLRGRARRWSSDLDEQLGALSSALSHPVAPSVDRAAGFEDVAAGVVEREDELCEQTMAIARGHVVGPVRRPVDAADVEAFWRLVRAEAGTVIDLG